ncbi:uncharacterized protein LOC121055489 [Oryza brachyantha]|uniref:uncharacterized protein LOC121055489 n=1 Tax=Oryza brachyantha TaxID=4533 RepID=UPI001ADAA716|nr:uncharacterized protein LOC121055489 [Oryza brachyantha]
MAKISGGSSAAVPPTTSLAAVVVLVLLAGAAASVGAQAAGADDAAADEEARSIAALSKGKVVLKVTEFIKTIVEEIYKKSKEDKEERSAAAGGGGVGGKGRVGPSGAVSVVSAGSRDFSALVVDVTSDVTWTSQCGGGQRRVQCGDPLCKQYAGGRRPSCGGGGAAQACSAGKDALLQGNVSLSTSGSGGKRVFSGEDTVYACRPGGGYGDGNYAIVGLGRGSVFANSSKTFSYLVDANRRSFVWLGDGAVAPATGGGRKSTTQLISVVDSADMDPSFYYVNITGIKVGDGRVSGKNAATTAILTTTMPFTFLNPALFDHLKQELHTTAAAAMSGGSDFDASLQQQCYPKETKLPELTLLLAGKDAAMALEPEHYSYKKSHGVVCLSILRSPLAGGVSVVGSMLQAGRRMTYNLDDDTLTFDSLSQAKAASSAPSPPSSSLSRYSSHAAVTPAFPVSSAWLSLLLAMMTMGMM